jgi:DNA polymerase
MGGTLMTQEKEIPATAQNLTTILNFYKHLGFDMLPKAWLRKKHDHHITAEDAELNALRQAMGNCRQCRLSNTRTNIVFGEGNSSARIMFIGEAPGREEDLQGRPFVGEAGQILTSLIEKMGKDIGLARTDVYIANIVKCRPPANRDPQEDEIKSCLPYLYRQVEIICPDVIMALGKISAHTLSGTTIPLSRFSIMRTRGEFFELKIGNRMIPVMPTFHPAYFLRNPKDKWLTWKDAHAVLNKLAH